jgi:hypothetical protein
MVHLCPFAVSPRVLSIFLLGLLTVAACDRNKKKVEDEDPPPPSAAPLPTTPPAAFSVTPVSQFADAGDLDGKPPLEQAREYEASGQLWMARLVLEKKALGPDGTKEEAEFLAKVCVEQGDEACVALCSAKVGHKIKLDAGAPRTADAGREHKEPDTNVARARDLVLKAQYDQARTLLEPRVLDGSATKDEIRMLKTVCDRQGDRMCVALCAAKLR